MDRQKFNKDLYIYRHKFNKTPVWIDKELSAIVEGNLLPTILASATVDE